MKIFTSAQIHELDKYTIDHEPIKSIDLMERAALRLTDSIVSIWDKNMKVVVFAGPGNNGGDALAVARMLAVRGYNVSTWLFNTSGRLSDDCKMNRERLKDVKKPITVAVMGCVVNGPGEAAAADVGIAGGRGEGLLFAKGKILRKVPQEQLVDELFREIEKL